MRESEGARGRAREGEGGRAAEMRPDVGCDMCYGGSLCKERLGSLSSSLSPVGGDEDTDTGAT